MGDLPLRLCGAEVVGLEAVCTELSEPHALEQEMISALRSSVAKASVAEGSFVRVCTEVLQTQK